MTASTNKVYSLWYMCTLIAGSWSQISGFSTNLENLKGMSGDFLTKNGFRTGDWNKVHLSSIFRNKNLPNKGTRLFVLGKTQEINEKPSI